MSDPGSHESLARESEAEADDLERRSRALGSDIESAKEELHGLESDETIATPERVSESKDPPPETQYPGKRDEADERADEGV